MDRRCVIFVCLPFAKDYQEDQSWFDHKYLYALQPDRLKNDSSANKQTFLSSIADSRSLCMLHSSKGVSYHMLFTNQHQSCLQKAWYPLSSLVWYCTLCVNYFRSWSQTLFWKPLAMPRQSGMTTHLGLANLLSFSSTRQAESAVQQSGRTCWRDHELSSLQTLSATTIYSIRSAPLQKNSAP